MDSADAERSMLGRRGRRPRTPLSRSVCFISQDFRSGPVPMSTARAHGRSLRNVCEVGNVGEVCEVCDELPFRDEYLRRRGLKRRIRGT